MLNLRQFHSDRQNTCCDLELFQVGINTTNIKDHAVIKALKIINASEEPILIHCWHGSDRTGLIVALYRIVFQDWSKEAAIDEMVNGDFGHHTIFKNLIHYIHDVDVEKLRALVL